MKIEICLKTWYQEQPSETSVEKFSDVDFTCFEDAIEYLYLNKDKILDIYPVVGVEIKPIDL